MELKNIKIEFKKNFIKEESNFHDNIDLENNKCKKLPSHNFFFNKFDFLNVNFNKKDAVGYIKIKNADIWLHENIHGYYFDKIRCGLFEKRQPDVVWIDYLTEGHFIVFKPSIFGYKNKIYLNYSEKNERIRITWSNNMNDATIFSFNYYNEKDWTEILSYK